MPTRLIGNPTANHHLCPGDSTIRPG